MEHLKNFKDFVNESFDTKSFMEKVAQCKTGEDAFVLAYTLVKEHPELAGTDWMYQLPDHGAELADKMFLLPYDKHTEAMAKARIKVFGSEKEYDEFARKHNPKKFIKEDASEILFGLYSELNDVIKKFKNQRIVDKIEDPEVKKEVTSRINQIFLSVLIDGKK